MANDNIQSDLLHQLKQAVDEYELWYKVWDLRISDDEVRNHRQFVRDKLAGARHRVSTILDSMDPVEVKE